jgi:thiamine pyrophosphate-dependent acetolactate synthase large subunit-like protein
VLVCELVGAAVARLGAEAVFGVTGSGNFVLANAMRAAGIDYHAACHEAGAVAMADGYARASGRVGVATVHQGPGFTNGLTALGEAVKSATPLVVLAAEAPPDSSHSSQVLDQAELARAIGAIALRLDDPSAAAADVAEAFGRTEEERCPVVLVLPNDVQAAPAPGGGIERLERHRANATAPSGDALRPLADALLAARRPLIVAGRGAVVAGAAAPLQALGEAIGAPLTATIVAKGLFAGDPFDAGVLGGFASPLTWGLAEQADLLAVFGASLDAWTTCGGQIPGAEATLALVDDDRSALAKRPDASFSVHGDARLTAEAPLDLLAGRTPAWRWRDSGLRALIAADRHPDEIPPAPSAALDPRRLAAELDRRLPRERVVALDSGHFLAFASIYLDSSDGRSFLFAQGFQSVGLGLGVGIGAAVARPERVVAAVLGDGGARMSLMELDTAVRHRLRLAVIVFDDGGYGAEVHDFEPLGVPVDIARFPSRAWAAVGRALGATGVEVRSLDDLDHLTSWLERPDGPIVLDCKVDPEVDAVSILTEAGAAEWSMPSTYGATCT